MDLEEFEQKERLRKSGSIGREAVEDGDKPLSEVQNERRDGPGNPGNYDESQSPEALMQAYQDATMLAQEKAREAELYRKLLEQSNSDSRHLSQRADEEAFTQQLRAVYQTDPIAATAMMIRHSQDGLLDAIDDRIMLAIREDREFKGLLDDFLSNPKNSRLRPYQDELQFLIRDKGLHASEAADLLQKIEEKGSQSAGRRSEMARQIRNRSMVESDGEIGEPLDDHKEFDRAIKKAKNLDDLFASLRKLKI